VSRIADGVKTACVTVLGSGFGPLVPGTWGSLVATVLFALWWLVANELGLHRLVIEAIIVAGICDACTLSVLWGGWAIECFRSRDPKPFVLDEFAGQWIALLMIPVTPAAGLRAFVAVVAGQFVLFRVLDTVKPPPARQMERLRAGWGILLDDVIAGAYANIIGQLAWRLTPLAGWLGLSLGSGAAGG